MRSLCSVLLLWLLNVVWCADAVSCADDYRFFPGGGHVDGELQCCMEDCMDGAKSGSFNWSMNAVQIMPGGDYTLVGADNENLKIASISSEHEGKYNCSYMVGNEVIMSDGKYCVTIVDAPHFIDVSSSIMATKGDNVTYSFVLDYTGRGSIDIPDGLNPKRAEVVRADVLVGGATGPFLRCESTSSECSKANDFMDRISILNTPNSTASIYNLTFNLLNVMEEDNNTYTIEISATYSYTLNGFESAVSSFVLSTTVGLAVTQASPTSSPSSTSATISTSEAPPNTSSIVMTSSSTPSLQASTPPTATSAQLDTTATIVIVTIIVVIVVLSIIISLVGIAIYLVRTNSKKDTIGISMADNDTCNPGDERYKHFDETFNSPNSTV